MSIEKEYFKVSNEFISFIPKLSGNAVKIYLLFKRMINENKNGDKVWPTNPYIVEMAGVGKTSISIAINELIETGWISEINKGHNFSNCYHINDSSNPNFELIEKRKKQKEINSNRTKARLLKLSSLETELPLVQKLDENNTNINNTNSDNSVNNKDNIYNSINEDINNNINNKNKTNKSSLETRLPPIENTFSLLPDTSMQKNFLKYFEVDKFENQEDKKLFICVENMDNEIERIKILNSTKYNDNHSYSRAIMNIKVETYSYHWN